MVIKKEIVGLLLSKGVNVNATDEYGDTALMYGSYNGYKERTEMLKTAGAHD